MNRSDFVKHVRPLVEQLAEEIGVALWNRFEAHVRDAFEAARSALESDLERAVSVKEQLANLHAAVDDILPIAKPKRTVRTVIEEALGDADEPVIRAGRKCRACGKPGHRRGSAKCEKTSAAEVDDDQDEDGEGGPANLPVLDPEDDAGGAEARASVDLDDEEPDDEDDEEAESPAVARAGKRDRFAEIEESARKRAGVLPVPRSTHTF
jgi:hypothetical protein